MKTKTAKKKVAKSNSLKNYKEKLLSKIDRAMSALEKELDDGCFRRGEDHEVQIELEMYEIFYSMVKNTK